MKKHSGADNIGVRNDEIRRTGAKLQKLLRSYFESIEERIEKLERKDVKTRQLPRL